MRRRSKSRQDVDFGESFVFLADYVTGTEMGSRVVNVSAALVSLYSALPGIPCTSVVRFSFVKMGQFVAAL